MRVVHVSVTLFSMLSGYQVRARMQILPTDVSGTLAPASILDLDIDLDDAVRDCWASSLLVAPECSRTLEVPEMRGISQGGRSGPHRLSTSTSPSLPRATLSLPM